MISAEPEQDQAAVEGQAAASSTARRKSKRAVRQHRPQEAPGATGSPQSLTAMAAKAAKSTPTAGAETLAMQHADFLTAIDLAVRV